ncbi:MAG: SDR family NAD(P)-dependent oxidoreductase [Pseudomonas sp.]|uniref:SDR family NAD(P)-dependent oxidoreductase n=1 Tax=Pseudomonas sp. TaxID=306 RepID=UPI003D0CACF2
MSRTIVVFGAHTSLGALVARQYGNDGYDVVLVTAEGHCLEALITILGSEGIAPQTFIDPLTTPDSAAALVRTIRATVGPIDAVFYSPPHRLPSSPAGHPRTVPGPFDQTLAAVFNEVLPEMRARKAGTLLVAHSNLPARQGARHDNADLATRHYLQVLHRELASDGVHIGTLTVGSLFCHENFLAFGT